MTTTSAARLAERGRRASRRSWWADGVVAAVWITAAIGVSLNIAAGGLLVGNGADAVRASARLLGIVAAVLMMPQVLLASRAPWIERVVGHDRAIARHAVLGKYALLLMLAHAALIVGATASDGRVSVVDAYLHLGEGNAPLAAAAVAIGLFALVLATSLFAAFRTWNYESWHTVHLLVYVAIAFAVPHQFTEGSTYRGGGFAWFFWFACYAFALGSFVVFRMLRPLALAARHRARVESVTREDDGSATVVVRGRGLGALGARPGQFLLWRFYTPGLMWQKHPYSLSDVPRGDELRITVKPSGKGSRAVGDLAPGTWATFEGPLGVFTHDARVRSGLVLVAAGIGITPIRALLEGVEPGETCVVVVRARSLGEAPLLGEVRSLARDKGATLRVVIGSRGATWGTDDEPLSLTDLVENPQDVDVFVCGPVAWAREVERDALSAGASPEAVHRERFGW